VARRAGQPKKTKPTTVRFKPHLDEFVRTSAEHHRDGQSGVINDAVEFYMQHVERERKAVLESI
jgi:hypothetical protein